MQNPTSFNLDHAIAAWREELARQPGLTPADLRELEAHLRDAFADLRKTSIREEEAFLHARLRVGLPKPVAAEFAKAKPARVWAPRVFCLTFILVFGAFAAYDLSLTPEYLATATIKIVRPGIAPSSPKANPSNPDLFTPAKFETIIRFMETRDVAQQVVDQIVAGRMSPSERRAFLAPLASANSSDSTPKLVDRLVLRRSVYPGRLAYTLDVSFEHPNPHIAAIVADDFAQVFLDTQKNTNPRVIADGESFAWMNHAAGAVIQTEPKTTLILTGGFFTALTTAFLTAVFVHLLGLLRRRLLPTKLAS